MSVSRPGCWTYPTPPQFHYWITVGSLLDHCWITVGYIYPTTPGHQLRVYEKLQYIDAIFRELINIQYYCQYLESFLEFNISIYCQYLESCQILINIIDNI